MVNCLFCQSELVLRITTDSVDDFNEHDTVSHYDCEECESTIVAYFSHNKVDSAIKERT